MSAYMITYFISDTTGHDQTMMKVVDVAEIMTHSHEHVHGEC